MPVCSASLLRAGGWMVPSRGKLTPPQFIRAGVFMCRHVHREGNGGLFLFRCTAGSTVATCVHRIGHMAHSTQLTIPAMHAHIKATESIILMLSLRTGSRTPFPRPHTRARGSSGCRHSEHTTHLPAQPPHPHHQIHLQESQPPLNAHGQLAAAATRASAPAASNKAKPKFPAIPLSMEHGAQLNAVTRGASHPQERRLGVHTPSSLLLMATEEYNSRHTQLPACTAKEAFKSTAMCILCVCLQKHKA
ncbi:hypothetical protein ECC02_007412 [Trypanosoma cruzi]|uniref:Uncharacterized protein n=1 Tax=Trypanosoma cruzi TaxID=5693 RepID=A0A7J6XZL1_TRYCR|nr:hypothetical protein ECC02_007412 [Trypanosoma cruzi]